MWVWGEGLLLLALKLWWLIGTAEFSSWAKKELEVASHSSVGDNARWRWSTLPLDDVAITDVGVS